MSKKTPEETPAEFTKREPPEREWKILSEPGDRYEGIYLGHAPNKAHGKDTFAFGPDGSTAKAFATGEGIHELLSGDDIGLPVQIELREIAQRAGGKQWKKWEVAVADLVAPVEVDWDGVIPF